MRREWWILAILFVIGVGLRVARLEQLAIEHFDEGVYASNVYAENLAPLMGTDVYPSRHLYAPPLFPWLCEIAVRLGGTPDAAIWVNLLFGSLMIPLVWFVARDQLGSVAAIVAAGLCATSDYHIFFSRSALTDISLGFWLLLAVWLAARGIQSGRGLELLGAGAAAALAWWTKYNGWLAVLIPLGGAGLAWGMDRLTRAKVEESEASALPLTRALGRWSVIAVVAALLWSPVLYDLQSVGGYSSVASNHKSYLVGLAGWCDSLKMHIAYQKVLASWIGTLGAILIAVNLELVGARVPSLAMVGLALTSLAGACSAGLSATWLTLCPRPQERSHALFRSMLVVWWLGLTLTTPLYRPYARLSLPWLVCTWLLIAELMDRMIESRWTEKRLAAWLVIILAGTWGIWLFGGSPTWIGGYRSTDLPMPAQRTGMRSVADPIIHEIDMARESMKPSQASGLDAAMYVVGEPALYCHLAHRGQDRFVVVPAPNMSVATPSGGTYLPKFIVTGMHVPDAELDQALKSGLIEPIWQQSVLVSDMVALDSASLKDLSQQRKGKLPPQLDHSIKIRVFRIRD